MKGKWVVFFFYYFSLKVNKMQRQRHGQEAFSLPESVILMLLGTLYRLIYPFFIIGSCTQPHVYYSREVRFGYLSKMG